MGERDHMVTPSERRPIAEALADAIAGELALIVDEEELVDLSDADAELGDQIRAEVLAIRSERRRPSLRIVGG